MLVSHDSGLPQTCSGRCCILPQKVLLHASPEGACASAFRPFPGRRKHLLGKDAAPSGRYFVIALLCDHTNMCSGRSPRSDNTSNNDDKNWNIMYARLFRGLLATRTSACPLQFLLCDVRSCICIRLRGSHTRTRAHESDCCAVQQKSNGARACPALLCTHQRPYASRPASTVHCAEQYRYA